MNYIRIVSVALVVGSAISTGVKGGCGKHEANAARVSQEEPAKTRVDDRPVGREYFPDTPGSLEYVIEVSGPGVPAAMQKQTIVIRSNERVHANGHTYIKKISTAPGSSPTYYRVDDEGVHTLSGAWERLETPFPIVVGSTCTDENGSFVAEGFESVTLPEGTYSNCLKMKVSGTFNGVSFSGYRFLAPGVGDVKVSLSLEGGIQFENRLIKQQQEAEWREGSFDLAHYALCEAQLAIGRWYSKCGESHFTKGPMHGPKQVIIQRKGVTCVPVALEALNAFERPRWEPILTITEADRLNGVDWKGVFSFFNTAFREREQNGDWKDWQSPGKDDVGNLAPFLRVTAQRKNEKWAVEILDSEPLLGNGYGPVDCAAIEARNPEIYSVEQAFKAGFAGDFAGFKRHFVGAGATASDAEARAFIESLRTQCGEFDSCDGSVSRLHFGNQYYKATVEFTAPAAGPSRAIARIVVFIEFFGRPQGELAYPPTAAPSRGP